MAGRLAAHRLCEHSWFSIAGIDTLSAADGKFGLSGRSRGDATLVPDRKSVGPEPFEKSTRKKLALDVEGVVNGGLDREEALR